MIVELGLLAAAGLLGYEFLRKKSADEVGAAMEDLAAKVASQGPRGEWVFKADVAKQVARDLTQYTFSYPDAGDSTLIAIHSNLTHAAIAADKSALAWATRMNQTKSVLAMLTLTTPQNALQKHYLRAVDPGKESQYGGTGGGGGYAVLAYAGAIPRNTPLPGTPVGSVLGEVPMAPGDEAVITTEMPGNLSAAVVDAVRNGSSSASLRDLAKKLAAENYPKSAAIVLRRAAELDAIGPPKSASNTTPTPPPPAAVPGTPPLLPTTPGPGMYKVTAKSGLNLRTGPSTQGAAKTGPTPGTIVQVVGFNPAGTWAHLGAPWNGWVCSSCPEGGAGSPFLTPAS